MIHNNAKKVRQGFRDLRLRERVLSLRAPRLTPALQHFNILLGNDRRKLQSYILSDTPSSHCLGSSTVVEASINASRGLSERRSFNRPFMMVSFQILEIWPFYFWFVMMWCGDSHLKICAAGSEPCTILEHTVKARREAEECRHSLSNEDAWKCIKPYSKREHRNHEDRNLCKSSWNLKETAWAHTHIIIQGPIFRSLKAHDKAQHHRHHGCRHHNQHQEH